MGLTLYASGSGSAQSTAGSTSNATGEPSNAALCISCHKAFDPERNQAVPFDPSNTDQTYGCTFHHGGLYPKPEGFDVMLHAMEELGDDITPADCNKPRFHELYPDNFSFRCCGRDADARGCCWAERHRIHRDEEIQEWRMLGAAVTPGSAA